MAVFVAMKLLLFGSRTACNSTICLGPEISAHLLQLSNCARGCDKFEENLLDNILRSAFTDTCFQVRSAACCQIKLLIEKFGVDWAVQRVFPFVVNIFDTSPNYLHRMVPLMAAKDVAPLLSPAQNAENFLPVVLKTLEDNIVNVRFAGAKALQSFIPNLDPSVVESKVCPALKGLSMDGDDDVRYFVTETLKLC
eukprot:716445_1